MFGEDPAAAAAVYILNEAINAEICSECGTSWRDCLKNNGRGPEGVCCGACHLTDTHKADAARRAEAARRRAATPTPSGDALDRATKLILGTGHNALVSQVAKLIDRADAAADKELPAQIGGHGVVHWHRTAERRAHQIADLDAIVRRRNVRIAELEQQLSRETRTAGSEIDSLQRELEELRRNGGANLLKAIDRANTAEAELAIAERKLAVADRQRREFLGHSRTANARRVEAERERDDARRRVAELESAGWGEVAEQAAERLRAAERRMRDREDSVETTLARLERCQRANLMLRTRALEDVTAGEILAELRRRTDEWEKHGPGDTRDEEGD